MKHQIVFLGSKHIGAQCLQYLLDNAPSLNMEVVAIRSTPRPNLDREQSVFSIASQYGIPCLYSLDDIPTCDIIYSVQHHEILLAKHIQKARIRAINLHLAPLPEYRGCNQFSFAIMDEVETFGVSIHEIDTQIDHGTLLFEDRFSIPKDIWVNTLHHMANEKGINLFKRTLPYITEAQLPAINIEGRKSSFHLRSEILKLKEIDLQAPLSTINKQIRATSMPGFEPPYFMINGKKIHCKPAD